MLRSRTRIKRLAGAASLGLVFLALSAGLILYARDLMRRFDGVSARIADAPVSARELQKIEEDGGELRLAAAWARGKKTELAFERLETNATVRPVTVRGEIRRVCPMELIAGNFPVADDESGCLLTADAAMELMHSVEAVGARVDLNGKTYVVRGIVKAFEPMILLRDRDAQYENFEFTLPELSNGGAAVRALLYRYGLGGDVTVIESGLYARIFYGLCFLPPALFLGLMSLSLARRARAAERRTRLVIGSASLMLLAVLILAGRFYWPQCFLPTKCSDFAFWGNLFKTLRANFDAIRLATPLPKDVLFLSELRFGLLSLIAALAAAGGFARSLTKAS